MGWLRKQPVPKRKHGNPERTLANKVGDVRIFLKEFGITKLLKKHEEPKYHEKKVVAHPDGELDVLYGSADAEETFLLDFFIGSMARDCEAYGCRYRDLTGTTLTSTASSTRPARSRLAPASPMRSTHAGSATIPNCCFRTATANPTSISCVTCNLSPSEPARSSTPCFTSCARLAHRGATVPASR